MAEPRRCRWEGEGIEFGPLKWAAPSTFEEGGNASYGYGDEVVLFSEATVAADASSSLHITASVDYLACNHLCMPGHSQLEGAVQVGAESVRSSEPILALMDSSKERVPRRAADVGIETKFHFSEAPVEGEVEVLLELIECATDADGPCRDLNVGYDSPAHALIADEYSTLRLETLSVQDHPEAKKGWILHLRGDVLSPRLLERPLLSGVIRLTDEDGVIYPIHVRENFALVEEGQEPVAQSFPQWFEAVPDDSSKAEEEPPAKLAASATAESPAPISPPEEPANILWVLFMAFLGGMILNLMPCVFPVLVLKVSSFATLAHESRKQVVSHGAAYTMGIVGSMLVLALVVIALRLSGTQVGWGFQFQQPYFLAALVVLLVLFSLNLFGVFEIAVSSQKLSESTEQASGTKRSFMEGVLAVVLATPCSAPFMGAAIGFALSGSIATILAVFIALGLGLAAPMVVLTLMPTWARLLPRPGNWMVHLKTFLGFALLGSGVWIAWLLGRAAGVDAMASMLMFSGLVAVAAWLYGLVQFQSWNRRKTTAMILAAISITVGAFLSFPLPIQSGERSEVVVVGDVEWHPWSEQRVQEELAAGRPVFVDFTADWCLTCKVNKRNAIDTRPTNQAIQKYNVATLRADWTHENEDIRLKLEEFNRAAIPFYLVYSPQRPDAPEMLAEVITPKMLVDAFKRAAGD